MFGPSCPPLDIRGLALHIADLSGHSQHEKDCGGRGGGEGCDFMLFHCNCCLTQIIFFLCNLIAEISAASLAQNKVTHGVLYSCKMGSLHCLYIFIIEIHEQIGRKPT